MSWLSFFLFLSFLYITFVFIQRPSSAVTNDEKKTKSGGPFSFLNKISSINGQIEDNVNELRCPERWLQLGYSCYLLSDYMSTAIQANHTCDLLHLNNSRLIYIQQSVQLMYAAHVLLKNDLYSLMLEIDQDLMKGRKIVNMLSSDDHTQWDEFEKNILQDKLKDHKKTTQSSKRLLRKHRYSDDNAVDKESTTMTNNEDKDQNMFKNVDYIRKSCDELKWNVIDENSNILILTVEIDSNKSICSLRNANIKAAYSHLCQYALDRCLNNIVCGKHGRCINSLSGFNCSCSFLYDGLFCEKFSTKDIQFLIAFPVLLLSPLLLITAIRDLLSRALKRLLCCFRRRQPTSSSSKIDQHSNKDDTDATKQHSSNQTSRKTRIEFVLSTKEQCIRFVFVFITSILFFLLLIGVPVIRYFISAEMNKTNSSKFDLLFNENIYREGQYGHNTIFRIENWIFLIISIIFSIGLSFLNVQNQSNDNNQSRIVEPIKPFYITDRYKTVVIITIQMFEILDVLDETLIDISEASQSGIFVKIFTRMFFVIINAFRYYPVLASLQFQDIKIRSLTFIYVIGITVFMIIRDNSYIYWLSFSKKMSSLERMNLHTNMNLWVFVYSLAKTCLYWFLIAYIVAELMIRLFYDSIYIALKNKRKITDKTYRKIKQYAFSEENMEQLVSDNSNKHVTTGGNNIARSDNLQQQEQGYWFCIKKFVHDQYHKVRINFIDIFKHEDNFRFTTIIIATYTIAFIFLFHLTFHLIFLYTTEKTNYITYLKKLLEYILNIKIKEQSFKVEVIFSAIITMIIYGLQLLHSIKNYKDNVTNLYNIYSTRRTPLGKPEDDKIISNSVKYPAYILRYLLGGFVICFNLILFIVIASKMIITRFTSFKWTLISIISVIIVYCLHQMINRIINTLFTSYNSQDQNNLQLYRPYSILLYFNLISTSFIGIISSIIRLIISVLVNILFMPRIDYSCFVQPLHTLDSAHMAFQCFIHWEFLYTRDILFRLSATVQPASNSDIQIRESTVEQQIGQGDHPDPQNMDENRSQDVFELRSDNDRTDNSILKQLDQIDSDISSEGRPLLNRSQERKLHYTKNTQETSL